MRNLARTFLRFLRDSRGALMAEFAAVTPVLLLLVMSGVEVSRFVLVNQKMDRAATTVADLVAQEEDVSVADMTALFDAISPIVSPFTFGANGVMIVTSVGLVGGTPTVNWQQMGGGTKSIASKIGAAGGPATLPTGMTVAAGQTIIVGEVFYDFTPLFVATTFSDSVKPQTLYHRAFYRPRFGALTTIN
jgi:Flp pilus assembly protein TadG